jgi:prepilin-type N-terminal cleavage/methylation domain-containing protein
MRLSRTWKRLLRQGFTLIELLVVMAIIGILAGMILPALARARENGRRTECLSNLNQIGQALAIYRNNAEDYLPSWPSYGVPGCTVRTNPVTPTSPTLVHTGDQGGCRNIVVGYSFSVQQKVSEGDPVNITSLAPGKDFWRNDLMNFLPVGLGILVNHDDLPDARILSCRSMSGTVTTYYNSNAYQYTDAVWKLLGTSFDRKIFAGDGTALTPTSVTVTTPGGPVTRSVAAILSSYSYRDHPFYCRLKPDNFTGTWNYANDTNLSDLSSGGSWLAQWTLMTKNNSPLLTAQFMTPPFKTHRSLGDRAICSDSFDYAPSGFGEGNGMAKYCHGNGYNVLYGGGSAKWFDDNNYQIRNWNKAWWPGSSYAGVDDLTISSPQSQRVWNMFDRAAGLDKEVKNLGEP